MVKSDFQVHLRHAALFLFNRNKEINGREMADELAKAYKTDAPKGWTCSAWIKRFKSGEWNISHLDDESRSGRPSDFDDEMLRDLVEKDPKISVRELASLLDESPSTVHEHLRRIGKVSKLGCWVPHRLSEKNKADRVRVATHLLERHERGELSLDDIVTGDEKWLLYANVVRKRSWVNATSTPLPTARPPSEESDAQRLVGYGGHRALGTPS